MGIAQARFGIAGIEAHQEITLGDPLALFHGHRFDHAGHECFDGVDTTGWLQLALDRHRLR